MANLFRAFLFKLKKDLTFRITLFIGLGIAVLFTVIYLLIDVAANNLSDNSSFEFMFCTGQNILINSLSPAQNFGIAIPVNLIVFTVMEFTQGTIRNKIIAGNSKAKIYLSLYLSGLVFSIVIFASYALLSFALGSIIGGFDPKGYTLYGNSTGEYIWKLLVLTLVVYITITTVAVFFATLFRNIAPCIPCVIILIMVCYFGAMITKMTGGLEEVDQTAKMMMTISRTINPMHSIALGSGLLSGTLTITNEELFWGLGNNLVYILLFLGGGLLIFRKRDVK